MGFQVGDRVAVYHTVNSASGLGTATYRKEGIVSYVSSKMLEINGEKCFHPKQCHKLVKKKKEKQMTFDPTKPVQTRSGLEACIIKHLTGSYEPELKALITHPDGSRCTIVYPLNGKFISGNVCDHPFDLINITQPKPLDLHVGGVYKRADGKIVIITSKDEHIKYPFNGNVIHYSRIIVCSFENSGKVSGNYPDLIEKLGDIGDLHPDIMAYLEGEK